MRRMNLPRRFRKIDGTYVKHHCAAKTHTPSRCLWLTSINAFCNSLRLVHTPAFIVGLNSVVVVFFYFLIMSVNRACFFFMVVWLVALTYYTIYTCIYGISFYTRRIMNSAIRIIACIPNEPTIQPINRLREEKKAAI